MLFHSLTFIGGFLPVAYAGYWLLGKNGYIRSAFGWLLLCSMIFYGWNDPSAILIAALSVCGNFAISRFIAHGHGRNFLIAGVVFNVALLGVLKYSTFVLQTLHPILSVDDRIAHIIAPVGISFYTFQQIAYLIDLSRGKAESLPFFRYLLFTLFFPQITSGPIVRYSDTAGQFSGHLFRSDLPRLTAVGLTVFIIGFCKKTVGADSIALYADAVFAAAQQGETPDFLRAWGGVLSYTFQLYFDFSGYIDMVLGAALLFGIRLPQNFNAPYKSASIIEFWRRWNITLSTFIRDQLYIPLGGNRKGKFRQYLNLFLAMMIAGLWHGAAWTFVFWGGLHGFYLLLNHGWRHLRTRFAIGSFGVAGKFFSWMLTFLAITVSLVFFRAQSFGAALRILRGMFSPGTAMPMHYMQQVEWWFSNAAGIRFPEWTYGALWLAILACIAFFGPTTSQIMALEEIVLTPPDPQPPRSIISIHGRPTILFALMTAFIAVFSVVFLLLYQPRDFLYFQF